ncbi:MAG: molybdopterin-synthase adenylyltransferase MoeB [Promethearchaeota archaeon]
MLKLKQELKQPKSEGNFSHQEIERYSRHLILPEVGMKGQRKLKEARVLLIGAGGLGSPLILYLAAAGVGTIGIVDFDVVDYSNLQRQIIHSTDDVGKPKLESARKKILAINPDINIKTYDTQLTSENALEIINEFDVVVDGTDNFPTRYLVNDACVLLGKPNVYASIFRFEGQVSVFHAKEGPCYRCLYAEPPPPGLVPSCAEGGVLGVLPGLVGTIQATEVIKLILGIGEPLVGKLLVIDALDMSFRKLKLRKNPECPICGTNPTLKELIDYYEFCGVDVDDIPLYSEGDTILPEELSELLEKGVPLQLIDVREPHEREISKIPGSVLMPLNRVTEMANALDKDQLTVVYCKSGVRSANAIIQLKQQLKFTKILNLAGGVNGWAKKVDPSIPVY